MKATQDTAWIVCVGVEAQDSYLGPYRTQEAAERVRRRLDRDIAKRGASEFLYVNVEPLRRGGDLPDFREEMLADLEAAGYVMPDV